MEPTNRRKFLQNFSFLLASGYAGMSIRKPAEMPPLSFSTLGCPDWSFRQILDFASGHGYQGIEIRGIQRELNLFNCPQFKTPEDRKNSLRMASDKGIRFTDLGSSVTLHFPEGKEREKNLDEGKKYIDLAQEINCPFVRVFPNNFLKERSKEATLELISLGLLHLAEHAEGSNVSVLVESHGDLVWAKDLLMVMETAEHTHVGMIWDIANMWTITKESPQEVYHSLHKYIRHTHIKDALQSGSELKYTLLGKGNVPVFDGIDVMYKGGYGGYYSFEWEKLWHPEIDDPSVALADFPLAMKKHFENS